MQRGRLPAVRLSHLVLRRSSGSFQLYGHCCEFEFDLDDFFFQSGVIECVLSAGRALEWGRLAAGGV